MAFAVTVHRCDHKARLPELPAPEGLASPSDFHAFVRRHCVDGRPTWALIRHCADKAAAISIHANPHYVDIWAENVDGTNPPGSFVGVTLHVGHHFVEFSSSDYGKRWRVHIAIRDGNRRDADGSYQSAGIESADLPIANGRGRAQAMRALARRCVELGRPWSAHAFYRQPE